MDKNILAKIRRKYPNLPDNRLEALYLWDRFNKDTITGLELIRLSFLRGMISKESYEDFLRMNDEDMRGEREENCNEITED